MNLHDVIRKPLVTEKSTIGRETRNLVTFAVSPQASKHEIRRAVETLFSVQVEDVHTMRQPRKSRRVGKTMGHKPEWKKAIVRLAEGQTIEFFEGV
ncbi:MAG TPA: 50S ribosomal protein L23 [Myxococcota bacterium]|nr:50S ribosomal protein L23 [Myxococcota bacterium]